MSRSSHAYLPCCHVAIYAYPIPACLLTPLTSRHPAAKSSLAACAPWCAKAEEALNDQVQVEQTIGHLYDSMAAYFDRDNVALPGACSLTARPTSSPPQPISSLPSLTRWRLCISGLAKFFAEEADSERNHARKIIEYMNERGGVVKLGHIEAPPNSDAAFASDPKKGDALCAMELALALEKVRSGDRDSRLTACAHAFSPSLLRPSVQLNYDKLHALDKVATDLGDFDMSDFGAFLPARRRIPV